MSDALDAGLLQTPAVAFLLFLSIVGVKASSASPLRELPPQEEEVVGAVQKVTDEVEEELASSFCRWSIEEVGSAALFWRGFYLLLPVVPVVTAGSSEG